MLHLVINHEDEVHNRYFTFNHTDEFLQEWVNENFGEDAEWTSHKVKYEDDWWSVHED